MKKRLPKTQEQKPNNDKSYTGRQKRASSPSTPSTSESKRISSKGAFDKTKSKESSEEGFRKNKRKRISSSTIKSGKPEISRNSEESGFRKTGLLRDKAGKKKFNNQDKPESKSDFKRPDFKKRRPEKEGDDKEFKKPFRPSRSLSNATPKRNTPTYKFLSQKGKGLAKPAEKKDTDEIRLNRYISNAGICSRREADELIASGLIRVNEKVVTEMGFKVKPGDIVRYEKRVLKREKFVYVLLNKPKDFITTTDDPEERRTVMDLVKNACDERIYPVGRLDRNTTGLLLLTNDGDLAEKLSHPSHNVKKIYQVEIDKRITDEDFEKIRAGVQLEDGPAYVDDLSIITPDGQVVGIEIHLGRNRIVRRIFEHLGYTVLRLDRVSYAGLTKKDLPRGHWRFLTEKEVIQLKHFSKV